MDKIDKCIAAALILCIVVDIIMMFFAVMIMAGVEIITLNKIWSVTPLIGVIHLSIFFLAVIRANTR